MKQLRILVLAALLIILLNGCTERQESSDPKTIRVGAAAAPQAEILEIAEPTLEKQGYHLEIVEYSDYEEANQALLDDRIDADYIQNLQELDSYNKEHKTDLVPLGIIHYDRFGLYKGDVDSSIDYKEKISISIPSEPLKQARALKVLERFGLISIDPDKEQPTIDDIVKKKTELEFWETPSNEIILELQYADFGLLSGNDAIFSALKLSGPYTQYKEPIVEMVKYPNVLVTRKGLQNDEKLKALLKALKSKTVRNFIDKTYGGDITTNR